MANHKTLEEYMEVLLEREHTLRYSKYTLKNRRVFLRLLCLWLGERGIYFPGDVTRGHLESYQRHLVRHRNTRTKRPLSGRTQAQHLSSLKVLFKWLAKERIITYNPAGELEMPRTEHKLPKPTLSAKEAEKVLRSVDLTEAVGIRDRAILETLYSTGMRRMEVAGLCLQDIDREKGVVFIRQGKGSRDRYVPMGNRALGWIDRYIENVRPSLLMGEDSYHVFLNVEGKPMDVGYLSNRVTKILRDSGVGKSGSCHLFRHTVATLMHDNGADIRYIKEMLGHANLSTTEVYTRVGIGQLKEVHTRTHPAEKKKPKDTESQENPTESR